MTSRLLAIFVAERLGVAGYTDTMRQRSWTPGYRTEQASPHTVRVWRDGPDEAPSLERYAQVLRFAGFTVTFDRPGGKRPSLCVTHP